MDLDLRTRPADVTCLLQAWQSGDEAALHRLMPLLYDDLQRLARQQLRRVPPGQTLSTGGLVHEGFLRIAGSVLSLNDRQHFLALMARVMRNVLIDRAEAAQAQRRGGDLRRVELTESLTLASDADDGMPELLDLDRAMKALGALDARKEQIVELSFFGGMTRPEIAETLAVSRATVDRELRMAMAWLRLALDGDAAVAGAQAQPMTP